MEKIITYVNPAFTRLTGYPADEVVGRYAGLLDSGTQRASFWTAVWATVASGVTWRGPVTNRRKDGSLVELESVISGIRDGTGLVTSFVQTDRDVTRERELEGALARDAREREAIEAAIGRIDPEGTPEAITGAACAEIVRLAGVDSAWVIALGSGRIIADAGRLVGVIKVGDSIPDARVRRLAERAVAGPWAEIWPHPTEDLGFDELISGSGLHTVVYAPLRGSQGLVGVIGFGAHSAHGATEIVQLLPALATFGTVIGALVAPGLESRFRADDARATVEGILSAAAFTPYYQRIVDLDTGAIVGYEALTRFADGTRPDIVFRMASLAGLGLELETATLRRALEGAAVLPVESYLSLNASPDLILSGVLRGMLAGSDRRITLEVTEHVVVDDYPALRRELAALGPATMLAVDDAGAGYASLRHILELAPDVVKLDIGLIRGIDADPARQALVAGMGHFAAMRKVRLVAEGIETAAELGALRALAIPYGQGYLLGRPQDGRGDGPWPTRISLGLDSL